MCLFLCELHFCLEAGFSGNICEGDFFVERSVLSASRVSLRLRVGLPQNPGRAWYVLFLQWWGQAGLVYVYGVLRYCPQMASKAGICMLGSSSARSQAPWSQWMEETVCFQLQRWWMLRGDQVASVAVCLRRNESGAGSCSAHTYYHFFLSSFFYSFSKILDLCLGGVE